MSAQVKEVKDAVIGAVCMRSCAEAAASWWVTTPLHTLCTCRETHTVNCFGPFSDGARRSADQPTTAETFWDAEVMESYFLPLSPLLEAVEQPKWCRGVGGIRHPWAG